MGFGPVLFWLAIYALAIIASIILCAFIGFWWIVPATIITPIIGVWICIKWSTRKN